MVIKNKFKLMLTAVAFFGFSAPAFAQLDGAGEILRAGVGDAELILQEYLRPIGEGVGAGLNSGWYNTAKTHSFLGFSLGFRMNGYFVPEEGLEFDLNKLGLTTMQYTGKGGASPVFTPTFSGADDEGQSVYINITDPSTGFSERMDMDLPDGIGIPYTGFPTVQASVGLLFDTDVMIRFVPTLDIPNFGEFGTMGFGVKHNIKQWIPVVNMLPFDLSAYFGTNTVKLNAAFEVNPQTQTDDGDAIQQNPALDFSGQGVEFSATTTSYGLIVGKSLPLISVYASIGQEVALTEVGVLGQYPLTAPNPNYHPVNQPVKYRIEATANNPVNLKYDNGTTMRATVGASLKLLFFRINADYSMGEYPVASAGLAFTLR
jgi:hypothetical protein